MGNCAFKGFGSAVLMNEAMIRVITSSGGMMELYAPITAECVTGEFPGHGIFRSRNFFSRPLLHKEELHVGELYYLLPLINTCTSSTSARQLANYNYTPYRMSVDYSTHIGLASKRSSDQSEVFQRCNSGGTTGGVWKVKLVISPEQLSEILSQEASTEALIESVRTVAKCGGSSTGVASSVANSDQWSLSSSAN